ncbi:hypothetical protein [Actinopolyspora halophila]|uniref:hypothetical protein n=1 Tax=Actinopolyspora halophila TaxID=1850 RepID=UPI00035F23A0|nr:hypothetical protein [Actinopolyspora halophila]
MNAPNAALLRATLDHILNHPERWDQSQWAMCFAGHALALTGRTLTWRGPDLYLDDHWLNDSVGLTDIAGHELGLTGDETQRLVAPDSTLADLVANVADITGGAVDYTHRLAHHRGGTA